MFSTDYDSPAPARAGVFGVFRWLLDEARGWRGRWRIARLRRLDDRMLKDIGVERADLDWALMLPPSRDPVAALAARVATHRKRRPGHVPGAASHGDVKSSGRREK
jgi:uncharacterized protein YjiS (DUF1127 family)